MGGSGFQPKPGGTGGPFSLPFGPQPQTGAPAAQPAAPQQPSFLPPALRSLGAQPAKPATGGPTTPQSPTAELPISPVTPATAAPTGGQVMGPPQLKPVEMGPVTADKVSRDVNGACVLGDQRTPGSYHVEEVKNPDGTITIMSDNIRITVKPVEGFQMPTDPAAKKAVLDSAYAKKAEDDKKAYGKTADDMMGDSLKGGDKDRYFDSEQHWMWALAASARTGGQIPPDYFMKLDPYGGTAGNGPQIQPGGNAGQPLSTISMAHDTDWDLGRYFDTGPLKALHDLNGVDPRFMGEVGLFDSGVGRVTAATQGANPFDLSQQGQQAMDNAPKYSDGFVLNPAMTDWNVQYSRQYAQQNTDSPVPFVKANFRPDQIFDR